MHPFQRFLQNLIAQRGWGEPESMGGGFDWQFTNKDGRTRRYKEDLQVAYEILMRDEGFDNAEAQAWVSAAEGMLPKRAGLELWVEEGEDVFEPTSEPGAWVEVAGRIWVPFEKAVNASTPEGSNT